MPARRCRAEKRSVLRHHPRRHSIARAELSPKPSARRNLLFTVNLLNRRNTRRRSPKSCPRRSGGPKLAGGGASAACGAAILGSIPFATRQITPPTWIHPLQPGQARIGRKRRRVAVLDLPSMFATWVVSARFGQAGMFKWKKRVNAADVRGGRRCAFPPYLLRPPARNQESIRQSHPRDGAAFQNAHTTGRARRVAAPILGAHHSRRSRLRRPHGLHPLQPRQARRGRNRRRVAVLDLPPMCATRFVFARLGGRWCSSGSG